MKTENDRPLLINEELLRRARQGEQAALAVLYESTKQEVYRTIHAMVQDEELVMDIQQDTYLHALERLDQLKKPESFLAWLRRIAVNKTKTQLSRKKPLLFSELQTTDGDKPELRIPDGSALPEDVLDRAETSRMVDDILQTLSPEQQLIVGMYYYEQIPAGQIAKELGVNPGTVHQQLHRGRKKIEAAIRALEENGIKLYNLAPVQFLLGWIKRGTVKKSGGRVLKEVLRQSAKPAATVGVRVGRGFFETVLGKLVLGVVAASVVGGGAVTCNTFARLNTQPPVGIFQPNSYQAPSLPSETEAERSENPSAVESGEAEQTCSRAQAVTLLWQAAGKPEPSESDPLIAPFTDLDPSAFCYKAVLWAAENGIAVGAGGTAFLPDEPCTREHLVTFLWRFAGTPASVSITHTFKDVPPSVYYEKAVLWAAETGVLAGTSEHEFSPRAVCTQAQTAALVSRASAYTERMRRFDADSYEIVYDACTWEEAQKAAAEKGGRLVAFDGEDEMRFILTMIAHENGANAYFYLGARRDENETGYHWIDEKNRLIGDALNASGQWCNKHWLEGEPSFVWKGEPETVALMYQNAKIGRWCWDDVRSGGPVRASRQYAYIIEYDKKGDQPNETDPKTRRDPRDPLLYSGVAAFERIG